MLIESYQPALRERQRVGRFLVVGASGTVLDFVLLTLLKALGLATLPANTLSFSAGIVNNFLLNRWWTYADARAKPVGVQFGQFALVSLIGLLLNNGIMLLLDAPISNLLSGATWSYMLAKILATAVVIVWNFVANRYWTFNDVTRVEE